MHSCIRKMKSLIPAPSFPKLRPATPWPQWFDRNHWQFWSFMNQNHFLFLILLTGDVLDWASPLLKGHSLVLSNWDAFLQLRSTIFDDSH
uniref:Uncharacterized protein n=1 Tax=Gopherus agassizii TaxID=38772 RepID=A0A452HV59_9SAUR